MTSTATGPTGLSGHLVTPGGAFGDDAVFGIAAGDPARARWTLPDTGHTRVAPTVTAVWHGAVYGYTDHGPIVLDAATGTDRNDHPGIAAVPLDADADAGVVGASPPAAAAPRSTRAVAEPWRGASRSLMTRRRRRRSGPRKMTAAGVVGSVAVSVAVVRGAGVAAGEDQQGSDDRAGSGGETGPGGVEAGADFPMTGAAAGGWECALPGCGVRCAVTAAGVLRTYCCDAHRAGARRRRRRQNVSESSAAAPWRGTQPAGPARVATGSPPAPPGSGPPQTGGPGRGHHVPGDDNTGGAEHTGTHHGGGGGCGAAAAEDPGGAGSGGVDRPEVTSLEPVVPDWRDPFRSLGPRPASP